MHELSLVQELVDVCAARSGGRPVTLVRVRHASTIPEDSLRQAFAMLTEGSSLGGAALQAESVPFNLSCPCGFDGALGHDDLISGYVVACPSCGDVSQRSRSAELELLEVRT